MYRKVYSLLPTIVLIVSTASAFGAGPEIHTQEPTRPQIVGAQKIEKAKFDAIEKYLKKHGTSLSFPNCIDSRNAKSNGRDRFKLVPSPSFKVAVNKTIYVQDSGWFTNYELVPKKVSKKGKTTYLSGIAKASSERNQLRKFFVSHSKNPEKIKVTIAQRITKGQWWIQHFDNSGNHLKLMVRTERLGKQLKKVEYQVRQACGTFIHTEPPAMDISNEEFAYIDERSVHPLQPPAPSPQARIDRMTKTDPARAKIAQAYRTNYNNLMRDYVRAAEQYRRDRTDNPNFRTSTVYQRRRNLLLDVLPELANQVPRLLVGEQ